MWGRTEDALVRTRHVLLLDSRDRNYTSYPSAASYVLPLPRTYRNVVRAHVTSAEVPTSFHVFRADAGNTTLRMKLDGVAGAATIPNGNFTTTTMMAALTEALDAAFAGATFTAAVKVSTGQLVLSNSLGRAMEIDTTAPSIATRTEWGLAYFLGFRRGAVYAASAGQDLTAPNGMVLNPYTYMLLDVDELNHIDECGGERAGPMLRGALCKVPLAATTDSYVFLQSQNLVSNGGDLRTPLSRLDRLTVNWRFHDNKPVDFNDVEHSVSLEIECMEPSMRTLPGVS